jgi:membrane associated rhomboid family serine protease
MVAMSDTPPGSGTSTIDESEETYCYGHPDTPTRLHCSRCDKPICGRCAVPAAVGQHCVWCVAEARKSAPKVRSVLRANAPVVYSIIVINVLVWIAQNLTRTNTGIGGVTNTFDSFPPAIFAGEWWRLITPMFLHLELVQSFGIFHIVMNMYVLAIFGPDLERAFGRVRFLSLYLIAGFMGNVASYAFGNCRVPGVGASGAIFGVVGALLVHAYRRRTSSAVLAAYMRNLIFFVGINLVIGFSIAGIDNLAHIGGLLGGAVLGAGLDVGPGERKNVGRQVATAIVVVGVGIALVMWRNGNFPVICGGSG